jgi:hypothetical protein
VDSDEDELPDAEAELQPEPEVSAEPTGQTEEPKIEMSSEELEVRRTYYEKPA